MIKYRINDDVIASELENFFQGWKSPLLLDIRNRFLRGRIYPTNVGQGFSLAIKKQCKPKGLPYDYLRKVKGKFFIKIICPPPLWESLPR